MHPPGGSKIVPRIFEVPGKPVAYNYGLLWLIYGLLWGVVACCFRLLGFPSAFAVYDTWPKYLESREP